MEISLLSVDVGFDIRDIGSAVVIDKSVTGVVFKDTDGLTQTFSGSYDEIVRILSENGYKVVR